MRFNYDWGRALTIVEQDLLVQNDGACAAMNPLHIREAVIENWMLSTIQDGGLDRDDDLHVDQIEKSWQPRERWIDGGLEAYGLALGLRDRQRLDVTVALAFSLQCKAQPADFRTFDEFQQLLDWSPPSLYLFATGKEPWRQSLVVRAMRYPAISLKTIDATELFGRQTPTGTCYLIEFKQPASDECLRTIFVAD